MELNPSRVGAETRARGLGAAACSEASPFANSACVELTLLTKAGGPLTKRIGLNGSGGLVADGSACVMFAGQADRAPLDGPAELAKLIGSLRSDQALSLGRLRPGIPNKVAVATARRISEGGAPSGAVARTREYIDYARGEPAYALLDHDRKGMPDAVADAIAVRGGFWEALVAVAPGLAPAARVRRASTSAGLSDERTGRELGGSGGEHVYLLVRDGSDIERFLHDLHARCFLAGFGWHAVGRAGQLLERSFIDRSVGSPERLVFEGPPVLEPPLLQDGAMREPVWTPGEALDTRRACPPLTPVERAHLAEATRLSAEAVAGEAARVREEADKAFARRIADHHGIPTPRALRIAETRRAGVLLPQVELVFDDPEIGSATVGDVLRSPARFAEETLADPLEGVAYGRCKAMVMRHHDGTPWIRSFAHGGCCYSLMHDEASVEEVLRTTHKDAVVDELSRLRPKAHLEPDALDRLVHLAAELSGTLKRPIQARLKQEEAARRKAERAERAARERDGAGADDRVRLPAPLPDDERTPVLRTLDEVLGAAPGPEPPMRNAGGVVAEIRARRPSGLHGLTNAGADAAEAPEDRLPAPEEPLISALDPVSLGLLVERHVEHFRAREDGRERAVSLPEPFLRAYLPWRESRLPVVRAVVTAPLVTRDGRLLAGAGLDRKLEVVFRIEPAVLALVPDDPNAITKAEVVEALRFLLDEWLCDVATGFVGRIVLLAYALTIIERVLLPERPAFFVTAGQRGGGKTTVLIMIVAAVLGRRPPAAAWSSSAEERRKALLAYLAEGVATLIWDNIERGMAISCPSIEKALTAPDYTDRILGETRSVTVPSTTVQAFTGNNIAPRGDMASRSLVSRLEVERPDPENRDFRHPDPVAWTLDNRARILRALYTVLLCNPQVRVPASERHPPKTRFKAWWDLVGAPLETAAMLAVEAQTEATARGGGGPFRCAPEEVDFGDLFKASEVEEDETAGMRELVLLLQEEFGDRLFFASGVATLVQSSASGGSMGALHDDGEAERRAERGRALRAALEGATGKALPPGAAATAHLIGKRLQMVVGRPVALGGGEIGTVVKARALHEANAYRVTITRANGR